MNNSNDGSIALRMEALENTREMHKHGGLPYRVLEAIERQLPDNLAYTAETGCGRSTILFSNLSQHHTSFCLDDRLEGEASSIEYYENSSLYRPEKVTQVLGPTQQTLFGYKHAGPYDCVLIDGPHGYPFPDLEYFHFYPHIREGGLLIVDDVHIASIGRMADIIQEDVMWHLEEVTNRTAIFRRTNAVTFNNEGDGWWAQGYNQRRTFRSKPFFIDDGQPYKNFRGRYWDEQTAPKASKRKPKLTRPLRKLRKVLAGLLSR